MVLMNNLYGTRAVGPGPDIGHGPERHPGNPAKWTCSRSPLPCPGHRPDDRFCIGAPGLVEKRIEIARAGRGADVVGWRERGEEDHVAKDRRRTQHPEGENRILLTGVGQCTKDKH